MGKYIKILSKYQGVIVLLMSKNEIDRCFSGGGSTWYLYASIQKEDITNPLHLFIRANQSHQCRTCWVRVLLN